MVNASPSVYVSQSALCTRAGGVGNGESEQDGEQDDERDDQSAQGLDDGGVAQEGQDPWMSTATMTRITLAGSPKPKPALVMRTSPAPTMRMSPSTSKPIWVTQLKKEMGRPPFGP